MPRTKLDPRMDAHRNLRILINGSADTDGRTHDDICGILGMCSKSATKYMRNPEKLPLESLMKLGRALCIPIDEFRAAMRY